MYIDSVREMKDTIYTIRNNIEKISSVIQLDVFIYFILHMKM